MTFKEFFASRAFTIILSALIALAALLLMFRIGMMVGHQRASASFTWGQDYHRVFGGPSQGFFGGMVDQDDVKMHGVFGTILKNENQTITVEAEDRTERSVIVNGQTIIRQQRANATLQDLIPHLQIVVIGSPDANGQITARLIRIIPPPPSAPMPYEPHF